MKHTTSTHSYLWVLLMRAGFTQEHADKLIPDCLTLRRLANKHHRIAEMDCNGVGIIRGQAYTTGQGGAFHKSAYLPDGETTIFTAESDKVEAKIQGICDRLGLRVEFQGDPRGYTVKVFKGERFLDIQG